MSTDTLKQLADDTETNRQDILESIRAIHGEQAAAIAMAITEMHILMRACERSTMMLASRDDDENYLQYAALAMQNMRASVLTRTILPLLQAVDMPEEQQEQFGKITARLVDSYTDLIKEL